MYKSAKNAGKLILFMNIALQWMATVDGFDYFFEVNL